MSHTLPLADPAAVPESFGLEARPFRSTPDPHHFYPSVRHERALGAIVRGLRDRCGLIMLAGAIGTGKTTLCNYIRANFGEEFILGYSGNPFFTKHEFLRHLTREFDIPVRTDQAVDSPAGSDNVVTAKDHLDALTDWLANKRSEGSIPVFILDEAHLLNPPLFEILLILSNLQQSGVPLLQIVLAGQNELLEVLKAPKLASLNQRIAVRQGLTPLSRAETYDYIAFRLRAAGDGVPTFARPALAVIWKASGGTPRLINQLCGRVLEKVCLEGKDSVRREDILEVVQDPVYRPLFGDSVRKAALPSPAVLTAVLAGLLLLAAGGMALQHRSGPDMPSTASRVPTGSGTENTPAPAPMSVRGGDQAAERYLVPKPLVLAPAGAVPDQASAQPSGGVPSPHRAEPSGTPSQPKSSPGAESRNSSAAVRMALRPATRQAGGPDKEKPEPAAAPQPRTATPDRPEDKPAERPAPVAAAMQKAPLTAQAAEGLPAAPADMRLSALAWDQEPGRRMVILNDKIAREGDTVAGAHILRIDPGGVVIEQGGRQYLKKISETGER